MQFPLVQQFSTFFAWKKNRIHGFWRLQPNNDIFLCFILVFYNYCCVIRRLEGWKGLGEEINDRILFLFRPSPCHHQLFVFCPFMETLTHRLRITSFFPGTAKIINYSVFCCIICIELEPHKCSFEMFWGKYVLAFLSWLGPAGVFIVAN